MDKDTQDDALRAMKAEAYQCVADGRLEEAQSLYERLCRHDPADASNHYNLGTILRDRKRYSESEAALRAALRIRPDLPEALHNLATVLTRLNRIDEAAGCYEQALDLAPSAISHVNLGNILLRQQRPQAAVDHYQQALALAPQHPGLHQLLATALQGLQRYSDAEAAYREALRLQPQAAPLHSGLGAVVAAQGRHHEATVHYREAVRLSPGADTYYDLATALGRQHENEEAISHYRAALRLNPAHLDAWNNLGNVFRQQGRYKAAVQCYREVLRLDDDHLQTHLNLGTVLLDTGRPDAALASYQNALRIDPDNRKARIGTANAHEKRGDIDAAYTLLRPLLEVTPPDVDVALAFAALCRPLGRCAEAITMMEDVLERGDGAIDVHDQILLHFALGKLLDAAADYPRAFAHYSQGNAMSSQSFNPRGHAAYVDKLIGTYTSSYMKAAARARCDSQRPVFIVGMLRSGTSLVEQILASHPRVFGAGELEEMDHIATGLPDRLGTTVPYPACVSHMKSDDCDALAQGYLEHLSTLSPEDAIRVTDKMPGNFLHLGLIAQLFPKARIIHCVRDPLDTCLSCFFHHFGRGLAYTNSLAHLAAFYREYRRLMAHWKRVIDLPMLEVRYETLVSDQDRVTRSLLDFCGLDWDERCLRFHDTRRVVSTASYDQVRQPLYDRSVGRWHHYAQYLAPLRDALEESPPEEN